MRRIEVEAQRVGRVGEAVVLEELDQAGVQLENVGKVLDRRVGRGRRRVAMQERQVDRRRARLLERLDQHGERGERRHEVLRLDVLEAAQVSERDVRRVEAVREVRVVLGDRRRGEVAAERLRDVTREVDVRVRVRRRERHVELLLRRRRRPLGLTDLAVAVRVLELRLDRGADIRVAADVHAREPEVDVERARGEVRLRARRRRQERRRCGVEIELVARGLRRVVLEAEVRRRVEARGQRAAVDVDLRGIELEWGRARAREVQRERDRVERRACGLGRDRCVGRDCDAAVGVGDAGREVGLELGQGGERGVRGELRLQGIGEGLRVVEAVGGRRDLRGEGQALPELVERVESRERLREALQPRRDVVRDRCSCRISRVSGRRREPERKRRKQHDDNRDTPVTAPHAPQTSHELPPTRFPVVR